MKVVLAAAATAVAAPVAVIAVTAAAVVAIAATADMESVLIATKFSSVIVPKAVQAVSLKNLDPGASNGVNHLTSSGGESDQVNSAS